MDGFSAWGQFRPREGLRYGAAATSRVGGANRCPILYDHSAVQDRLRLGIADHFMQRGMTWNSTSHCPARSTSMRWTTTCSLIMRRTTAWDCPTWMAFSTGIVVGPELILPSEWLPVIWGGEEPEFETEAEMRTVLGTIMGRYNEIIACLDSEPENFEPIFLEGPEDEVIASDWAAGFLDAVALRPMAWEPLIEDDRAGILMAADCSCSTVTRMMWPTVRPMSMSCWQRSSDMIPTCVAGIHEFWKSNGTSQTTVKQRRSSHGRRTRH